MGESIIDIKHQEWARFSSLGENVKNVFNEICRIPFYVIPEMFNITDNMKKMIVQKKGFCLPKHLLLGGIYEKMGMGIRYNLYSFLWNDLDIEYPHVVKKIAGKLPVTYHLACEININNNYILADATWDPGIKKTGLPVNEAWNAESDSVLAVKPIKKFTYENREMAAREAFLKMSSYDLSQELSLSRFSIELNKWFESIRKN